MSKNLSKQDENTEQALNDIFEATMAGNSEEAFRLMAESEGEPEPVANTADTDPAVTGAVTDDEPQPEDEDKKNTPPATSAEQPTNPSATDEVEALKAEIHRLRSDAGRVPFLQRRTAELERNLAELQRQAAVKPQSSEGDDPKTVELPKHLKDKVDKMREIDPDNADLLEAVFASAVLKAREDTDVQFKQVDAVRKQSEEENFVNEQYTALVSSIPTAPMIFKSPEWEAWKSRLTPAFRAMAESSYASEVGQAIHAFWVDHPSLRPATATASTPTQQSNKQDDAVAKARQSKLSTSVAVTASHPAKNGEEFDVEAAFKEAYESALPPNLRAK